MRGTPALLTPDLLRIENMADEYGPGSFFPEVFQNGVPDIQPALLELVTGGPRVRRD